MAGEAAPVHGGVEMGAVPQAAVAATSVKLAVVVRVVVAWEQATGGVAAAAVAVGVVAEEAVVGVPAEALAAWRWPHSR